MNCVAFEDCVVVVQSQWSHGKSGTAMVEFNSNAINFSVYYSGFMSQKLFFDLTDSSQTYAYTNVRWTMILGLPQPKPTRVIIKKMQMGCKIAFTSTSSDMRSKRNCNAGNNWITNFLHCLQEILLYLKRYSKYSKEIKVCVFCIAIKSGIVSEEINCKISLILECNFKTHMSHSSS